MTAPIAFPSNLFSSVSFDLSRYTAQNKLNGGTTQVRDMAEARWAAKFTTTSLKAADLRLWRAFWDSLRGGLRGFVAYDEAQAYPLNYQSGFAGMQRIGGAAFDGTASFAPVSGSQFQAALSNLPVGFALVAGDLLELRQSDGLRGLYRIMSSAIADAAGATTLTVEPRIIPGLFTSAAVARFERPSCIMIPDPASWSYEASARDLPPATFAGVQTIT